MNIRSKIPLVDLKTQYRTISKEIDGAIKKVVGKTDFIMGEEIFAFESEFSKFLNVKHAIGVSSGTDAIHLALKALDIGLGDEVILPSHTFTATAEPIVWLKAVPVFAEIDEKTYTLDPKKCQKLITRKTKAIIPVHLYGQPADLDGILSLAKKYNLKILEDAAQAHGAAYKNKAVGNFGDITAFSFYPGKNLGAYGDAGIVVTNNSKLAERVRFLRNHGRTEKYIHRIVGYGSRLDTLQAAILSAKLPHLREWNSQRRQHAALYDKLLSAIKNVVIPYEADAVKSMYHLYVIRTPQRDKLREFLTGKGIETGIHYPVPLHLQPAYSFLRYKKGDLPVTEKIVDEILSLPMYPEITTQQIKYICRCIKDFYS